MLAQAPDVVLGIDRAVDTSFGGVPFGIRILNRFRPGRKSMGMAGPAISDRLALAG
jgi:hypothetical protein